jgi:hypothetical protein
MSYLEGLPNLPNGSQSLGGIPHQKENNAPDEDDNSWLHRNGAYQMQQIAGRRRLVAMPLGQEPQTISTIARDSSQGNVIVFA